MNWDRGDLHSDQIKDIEEEKEQERAAIETLDLSTLPTLTTRPPAGGPGENPFAEE